MVRKLMYIYRERERERRNRKPKNILPQMGFEPTSPGLLLGCDDHYTSATPMLAT